MNEDKKVQKPKKILSIICLLKKIGVSFPILDYKCSLCKHEMSCIDNILSNSFNSFKYGYFIRGAMSLIVAILGILKTKKKYTY